MKRRIVIGDIHGCAKTFEAMLDAKLQITKDDDIYLLGDYIDRGPLNKRVVDKIIELTESGYNVYPIMGNHEKMLLDSAEDVHKHILWVRNGCYKTLENFGVEYARELPDKYMNFFKNLPYYYLLDDFVLTHGGLNFNIPDPFEDEEEMVWNRDDYVDLEKTGGRRIIAGHTPTPISLVKESLKTNKIMLDGGCVYFGKHPGLGFLVALELDEMKMHYLDNIDYR